MRTREKEYGEDVELDEQEQIRSNWFLRTFFRKRQEQRDEEERRKSIPVSFVLIIAMIPVIIGASYFVFFGSPLFEAPASKQTTILQMNPAPVSENPVQEQQMPEQPNAEVQPPATNPEVAKEPEVVVIQPTVNPMLLAGDPGGVKVTTEVLVSKFNERINTHVEPANVGLIPAQTGNMLFDSVVAMKYAYGNTESQESMNSVMQNAGEFVRTSANNGDTFAIALRQATYEEFKKAAQNALTQIPGLNEGDLLPAANNFGYYTIGMWYLANSDSEFAERESLVNQAANAFAVRVQEIEAQKAELAKITDEDNKTAPSDLPSINPEGQGNEQPNPDIKPDTAPAINPDPDPAPAGEPISLAEPRVIAPDLTAITVRVPTLTDYSTFPVAIAEPLKGFSGWSLNPEGVVLAVQQLAALLKTGTAGEVDEWVVWNTYGLDTPIGKAWLFTLVELTTLQSRWGEMSADCQNYLGPLLENPATPNAWDLRQRWGLNSCANFMDGQVFNEGKAMMDITYPSGTTEYFLHYGPDGRVDVMGAVWVGFGQEFPLKVGHRIRPRSLINLGEGLIKGLLNLP